MYLCACILQYCYEYPIITPKLFQLSAFPDVPLLVHHFRCAISQIRQGQENADLIYWHMCGALFLSRLVFHHRAFLRDGMCVDIMFIICLSSVLWLSLQIDI